MKLKEIDLGYRRGLYTMAFVYSRDKGNILIKGQQDLVATLIGQEYTPCIANFQRFSYGKAMPWWRPFTSEQYYPIYMSSPEGPWSSRVLKCTEPRRNKFKLVCYPDKPHGPGKYETSLSLRRIPKKWIPEYDKLLVKRQGKERHNDLW